MDVAAAEAYRMIDEATQFQFGVRGPANANTGRGEGSSKKRRTGDVCGETLCVHAPALVAMRQEPPSSLSS